MQKDKSARQKVLAAGVAEKFATAVHEGMMQRHNQQTMNTMIAKAFVSKLRNTALNNKLKLNVQSKTSLDGVDETSPTRVRLQNSSPDQADKSNRSKVDKSRMNSAYRDGKKEESESGA